MGTTSIEWADAVWNPVTGCTKVSEGCRNCYAERMAKRLAGRCGYPSLDPRHDGAIGDPFSVTVHPEHLGDPLRWRRPRRIFVCSMGDLFHPLVSDTMLFNVFNIMRECPQHTFLVLTKRPQRMADFCQRIRFVASGDGQMWLAADAFAHEGGYSVMGGNGCTGMPWVWLGTSVEDQATADARLQHLLAAPAAVHFVSCEPLLGPVDLTRIDCGTGDTKLNALAGARPAWQPLDWVIVGGESGPHARPMHPDWARSLRDQCEAAGVPLFVKQWGEWSPQRPATFCRLSKRRWSHEMASWAADGSPYNPLNPPPDHFPHTSVWRVGKRAAGRLLDGREHNEYPEVSR